jgi:hypothetical protein
MGLIVAIIALTFVASFAGKDTTPRKSPSFPPSWRVGSYLAFIVLLKLQFPVWPSFISG